MPVEFPSRICQIIARKQWMACSKYARKRRECGDCMADSTGGLRGRLRSGRRTQAGYMEGRTEKRARGSRRSGKESGLEGAKIARVQNRAGTWQRCGCWGEPKEPYAGRGRDEPRTRGLGASAEGARRSGDEDRALRASRKREDAEQTLGHMNRRALERGRRSRRKTGVGLLRLFDRAQARERYPLAKDPPLVDINRRFVDIALTRCFISLLPNFA